VLQGSYGKDTVRPLTVKQILDANQPHPDADFRVDGEPISQVQASKLLEHGIHTDSCQQLTFVGQIRSISTQPTNITYKVDDGTGLVEVKLWIDGDAANSDKMEADEPNKPRLVEDGYCRVWGRLKAFNNKRHVGAHIIRPITDYNEINYHLLEATAVHLFFTRGPPNAQTDGQKGAGMNGVNGAGQQDFGNVVDAATEALSPLARRVLAALRGTPQSNEGLHVQMIASSMNLPTSEVYKGAEELLAVGMIFTTVDDNTWAVLDA
jgi:replication factor A2